jgi:hypothetical protein
VAELHILIDVNGFVAEVFGRMIEDGLQARQA